MCLGKRLTGAITLVCLLLAELGISYVAADDPWNHVANGIRHGCPYDYGCNPGDPQDGDHVRKGYDTRCNPNCNAKMKNAKARVLGIDDGLVRKRAACGNAYTCTARYPTDQQYPPGSGEYEGDERECAFKTRHKVEDPWLDWESHWTANGDCYDE